VVFQQEAAPLRGGGEAALRDRSSRPDRTRNTFNKELAEPMEQLRRARMPMRRIASVVRRRVATASRFLAGLGLSSLKALEPVEPVVRYERYADGGAAAPESLTDWLPKSTAK
jgi:hypothetical protein